MTWSRIVPCPTNRAKLGEILRAAMLSRNGLIGSGDEPSGPSISVVTPWRV
jgi:hypothetical protein